jgi:hypothetical protein
MNARTLRSLMNAEVRQALAVLAFAFSTATPLYGQADTSQKALRNESIVDLTKAGIDEATIVKLIGASLTKFDTSPVALIALKNAGVSNVVIDAMVTAELPKAAAPPSSAYPYPQEVGVYVNQREQLVPLRVEIITWRTGGVVKQQLTLSRGHINAMVGQPMSALRLHPSSFEFVIYCPEGVAPEEYQLLRFWEKKDRREFRVVTGGVVHATSGAAMNAVKLDVVERLAPRLYRVTPRYPLQKGEYGFLPPGAALSASAASSGKIYTFAVLATKR